MLKTLKRNFYKRNTLKVAQDLLGCFLVRKIGNKVIRGVITETEAYIGEDDLACHASRGRTPRTEIMYGEAGHAYVYIRTGCHLGLMLYCTRLGIDKLEEFITIEIIEYSADSGRYAKSARRKRASEHRAYKYLRPAEENVFCLRILFAFFYADQRAKKTISI